MNSSTVTQPTFNSPNGVVTTFVKNLILKYRQRQMRIQTTAALSKMSDRELRDIGICRGDIYDLSIESAKRCA